MSEEMQQPDNALVVNGLVTDIGPLVKASAIGFTQLTLDWGTEEFKDCVEGIGVLGEARQFIIGDAMINAAAKLKDRRYKYLEDKGISKELANVCEWVCLNIPPEYRQRRPVTFEHHKTVAGLKANCSVHNDGNPDDCTDCETARLEEIQHWLKKAAKLTVIELKTEIQEARAASDGKPKATRKKKAKATEEEPEIFDPALIMQSVKLVKHHMSINLKPRLTNLVTNKGRPDRRRIQGMLTAVGELKEALDGLESAGNDALASQAALAK
jgi:hypothetical protein